ncbi:MAG: type II secretion system minor pseudopilin GspK [Gammaproteobacteria bacterium]
MKSRHRQQGIAALTAILVVAIATILAVNLLWQTSVEMRRTENLLLQDQARQYDLGGEEFAKFGLAEDFRQKGAGGIDSMDEGWAKPLAFEVEGGSLQGFLRDQQGLFDLNSLVGADGKRNPPAADQYRRLLTLLELEQPLDPGTAEALVETTIDWIDPDTLPELNGAEDDRYTGRDPPYRPANFWFTSTSELLAVEGYTGEIYSALQPYITALPRPSQGNSWPLNINTAPELVLASLMENTSVDDMKPFVNGAYELVEDFRNDVPGAAQIPQDLPLDVRSSWFLLTASASIGSAQSIMYSLLERDGEVIRTRRRTFEAK